MGEIFRISRGGIGKLTTWAKIETGEILFTGIDEAKGIDAETPVLKGWCCLDPDNVWAEDGVEAPCEICPRQNFQLSQSNERLIRCWRFLDMTGRDRMMSEGFLREEAIDRALTRYSLNDVRTYERLIYLDTMILEHREKNKPKEKG